MNFIKPPSYFFCLPFTYFWKSRLTSIKDWVFHCWNEWAINYLLLLYATHFDVVPALKSFGLGYIAFISIYEIGYIVNDFYSVKKEESPRYRFTSEVNKLTVGFWIVVRTFIFLIIGFYLNFPSGWIVFNIALALVFTAHNLFSSAALKTFSFLQLAVFRFWAPVFLFIPKQLIFELFPVIIFYYVFNRTLTYMDSKGLLKIPERTSIHFKLGSSTLLLIFVLFWAYFVHSWLCLFVAVYFLSFWIAVRLFGSKFSPSL